MYKHGTSMYTERLSNEAATFAHKSSRRTTSPMLLCSFGSFLPGAGTSAFKRSSHWRPTGAVIPGARITIENRSKAVKRELQSDSTGDYVAPNLESGLYSVSAEAANFRKVVRNSVQVEVGKDIKIDFELPTGAARARLWR